MRTCAVSVDLDEIHHYSAIHGFDAGSPCHTVYDVALERMRSLEVPLTLFVVAADTAREQNVEALRRLASDGHEIANHSLDHLYDLTRRETAEQRRQVVEANALLEARIGVRPTGFRAPGYTVTDELLDLVRDAGMAYDSSVFPCPAYYAAKAVALLGMKLRGRRSRSVLDTPAVLRAPLRPYRRGVPYWKAGNGLLELPIQVAGPLRLPFIGTTLNLLGPSAAPLLTRSVLGSELVNLELHGVDFLDHRDVPAEIARVQPDLRVPWPRKRDTLRAVLGLLREHGYRFVRLDEAAREFA